MMNGHPEPHLPHGAACTAGHLLTSERVVVQCLRLAGGVWQCLLMHAQLRCHYCGMTHASATALPIVWWLHHRSSPHEKIQRQHVALLKLSVATANRSPQ